MTGYFLSSGDNLIEQAFGLLLFLKMNPVEKRFLVDSGEFEIEFDESLCRSGYSTGLKCV
jgi:hypothetical protein